jgi:hypothetical protein
MDWNLAQANWPRFKDEVQAHWTMLTSGQLDLIAGRRARLANNIEQVYRITGEQAERQIRSFEMRNLHPRPVSFR